MAQGISVGRVFAIAWGAAAALAVVGAICASMSPIGTGTVTAASAALAFRALPAVILGGLDSVAGALVGGHRGRPVGGVRRRLPRRVHQHPRHGLSSSSSPTS